jgi:hypothetical protein
MSSTGRNNPCAIEHLLMGVESLCLEEIAEKYPLETWFSLYAMISSNLDQEEVFSMGNNQMLRFGNSLSKLL